MINNVEIKLASVIKHLISGPQPGIYKHWGNEPTAKSLQDKHGKSFLFSKQLFFNILVYKVLACVKFHI